MFSITYMNNEAKITAEFNHFDEIIAYVATNRIKDGDFISMDLDGQHIEGMQGLVNAALSIATGMKIAREMANDFSDIDYDDDCDF